MWITNDNFPVFEECEKIFRYFSVDGFGVCRFSTVKPLFTENGETNFPWIDYKKKCGLDHNVIHANMFKFFIQHDYPRLYIQDLSI